jgi:cytochrome c-type biogenesis protein CcmH
VTDITAQLRQLLLARAAGEIDGEEFERRQAALHAELLAEPAKATAPAPAARPAPGRSGGAWPWLLGAAVVAVAGGLYAWLGNPAGTSTEPPTAVPPGQAPMAANGPMAGSGPMTAMPAVPGQQAGSGGDLKVMAQRLADKLSKDPNNGEGWALLARTYVELRQHADADAAFTKAEKTQKLDPQALADWADAHVVANDRKWDAKARDLVKRALAAEPKNLKALALAGSEAFDRKDYKQAIAEWKKMRAAAAADSMDAKLADANIAEATAVMTGKRPAEPAAPASAPAAAAGAATVSGTVNVAAALKSRLAATDVVFVLAKPVDGVGAPLAVKRFTVADLPARFKLTDQDAMMPERSLSRFPEVQVFARISKTGDAIAKPGDPASKPQVVKVGAADIAIEIAP